MLKWCRAMLMVWNSGIKLASHCACIFSSLFLLGPMLTAFEGGMGQFVNNCWKTILWSYISIWDLTTDQPCKNEGVVCWLHWSCLTLLIDVYSTSVKARINVNFRLGVVICSLFMLNVPYACDLCPMQAFPDSSDPRNHVADTLVCC